MPDKNQGRDTDAEGRKHVPYVAVTNNSQWSDAKRAGRQRETEKNLVYLAAVRSSGDEGGE